MDKKKTGQKDVYTAAILKYWSFVTFCKLNLYVPQTIFCEDVH